MTRNLTMRPSPHALVFFVLGHVWSRYRSLLTSAPPPPSEQQGLLGNTRPKRLRQTRAPQTPPPP